MEIEKQEKVKLPQFFVHRAMSAKKVSIQQCGQ